MLKSRFIPYIVGGCIVAFLSVSYVGYRTYQNHVEFKAFVSNAHPFNRSIEGGHVHSSNDHTHGGEGLPVPLNSNQTGEAGQAGSGHEHGHHLTPSGEYVYEINGIPLYSDTPMSQEEIAVMEWVETGKMTPAVEEQLRLTEIMREQFKLDVIQRVVTPDGTLHQVIVPRDAQYAEGDAISRSELDPPILEDQKSWWAGTKLIIEGVDYYPPEEYYSIADPYEREEYFNKFTWAIGYGISMAEVEKKVAQGELDFSLSEDARKHVDQSLAIVERSKMLGPGAPPPLSDKPPVKVSFLPDEGEFALPGWMRKQELQALNVGRSIRRQMGGRTARILADGGEASGAIFDEGSLNGDASGASVRSDNPLSPSDLSGVVESTFTHRSKPGIETSNKAATPPTAENVETQLREQLSRFDKAQQLFDKAQQLIGRYGSEEGLRRFREMHPEAAAQFERKRRNTRRVAR
jgi:hypothetical protein